MSKSKIRQWALNADLAVSIAALILLVGVTFFGVVMRYIFHAPFVWQEEVQLALILWAVFFAGGAAFRTGNHVAIDMVVNLFPPGLRKAVDVAVTALALLVLAYLIYYSCQFVLQLHRTGRTTNILKIHYWKIYLCFPVSSVIIAANFAAARLRELSGMRDSKGKEGGADHGN